MCVGATVDHVRAVCVCVCVCVSCASTCVPCFPPRDRAAWPAGGLCCRSARERIGDSERNSSACVLSGVSRCGTCMCTELCRAGWVVAASMCCETTHLCVRHGVRVGVCCVGRCSDYRRRSLGALYVCITGKAAVCESRLERHFCDTPCAISTPEITGTRNGGRRGSRQRVTNIHPW